MKGFIARTLIEQQDVFLHLIGSDRSGLSWSRALSQQLWKTFEQMWEQRNSFIYDHPDTSEHTLQQELQKAIGQEFKVGPEKLPSNQKAHFHHNLQHLLDNIPEELVLYYPIL